MSKNKFTPGPWHVVLSDNATPFITHEGGQDWSDIDDRSSRICHLPAEVMEGFNSLNNARLIAAAPELLQALENLLTAYSGPDDRICCNGTDCGCMGVTEHQLAEHYARAAIAKARGE